MKTTAVNVYTHIKSGIFFMVLCAAGTAAPYLYHLAGLQGSVFLPIFLILSLSAYKMDSKKLFIIALMIPLSNYFATGMPAVSPLPVLQYLMFEGLVFSSIIGAGRKLNFHFPLCLFMAVILGRFSSLIFIPFYPEFTLSLWLGIMKMGFPGMIVNYLAGYASFVYFSRLTNS